MRRLELMLVCGLILILALSTFAQNQEPPAGGVPKDFVLPKTETFKLDNGMAVTLVPYGTLPKVNVRVVVRTGNLDEGENEIWLADLTGNLMKEGTKTRTAAQITSEAAGMGGDISISVGPEQTYIQGEVLSRFAPHLVALLGDVIQNPLLPESEIERLKNDLVRSLSVQLTQPDNLALDKFRQVLYGKHPFGNIFPTEAMLKSYTVANVRAYYEKNFGAIRTHIYIAGVFDSKAVKKAIRASFSGWNSGPEPLIMTPTPVSEKKIFIVDRPGAPQSTVFIGKPVINPADTDYVAMIITNALLGGMFSSRITTNIREDKGYTYSPNSALSVRYRDAYWLEEATVGTEVTAPTLKEIFYEIQNLCDNPPSEEELKGVQNYMAGIFVLQNSSRNGLINQLAFLNLHGLDASYLTNYVKNVHNLKPQDIQNTAKHYLEPGKMTIVIAGDRKKIAKDVSQYGPLAE